MKVNENIHSIFRFIAAFLLSIVLVVTPVFKRSSLASGAIGSGSVTWDPGLYIQNAWDFTKSNYQDWLKYAQMVQQTAYDLQLAYMMAKDIQTMPTGSGFFSNLANLSMILGMGAQVGAQIGNSVVQMNGQYASMGATPLPPGTAGPSMPPQGLSTATTNEISNLSSDLQEFGAQAQMTAANAYSLQMLSTMNMMNFSGAVSAIQTGTSAAIQMGSQFGQYQQWRLHRSMLKDQRRMLRATQRKMGEQITQTNALSTVGNLESTGCFASFYVENAPPVSCFKQFLPLQGAPVMTPPTSAGLSAPIPIIPTGSPSTSTVSRSSSSTTTTTSSTSSASYSGSVP